MQRPGIFHGMEQSKWNLLGIDDCTIFEKSQLAMNQAVYDPNQ